MSGNHRPLVEPETSYKRTGIPCGNPRRYSSSAVTRMCPAGPPYRHQRLDLPVEDIETEGDRQLKVLLKRQLDTDVTLDSQLSRKKLFASPTLYNPLTKDVSGPKTLAEYQSKEQQSNKLDELRKSGLSDEEIQFKWNCESGKLEHRVSGYGMEPSAVTAKLDSINGKIQAHNDYLDKPVTFADTKVMSRHEMDLELSISHDKDKAKLLGSLVVQGKSFDPSYADEKHPINHLDSILEEAIGKHNMELRTDMDDSRTVYKDSDFIVSHNQPEFVEEIVELEPMPEATCAPKTKVIKRTDKFIYVPDQLSSGDNDTECHQSEFCSGIKHTSGEIRKREDDQPNSESKSVERDFPTSRQLNGHVEAIPSSAICKYRLSADEIKKLDRFKNYEPGCPTNTLFLKNLSTKVSEVDLVSLFLNHQNPDAPPIEYRLLSGRMKGQAFVTFHDVETATKAMELVNGYHFKGKPIIIQYGKK